MEEIDWAQLINWTVSGFIGLIFGAIGAFISYRFTRKRDDIKWQRQLAEQERQKLIDKLTRDIDNPRAIQELAEEYQRLSRNFVTSPPTLVESVQLAQVNLQFLLKKLRQME